MIGVQIFIEGGGGCYGNARRGGGGRAKGGSDIFLWGDKGANFVFRVMGVITSDRKHFSNTDPFVYCAYAGYVCVGGGGGE